MKRGEPRCLAALISILFVLFTSSALLGQSTSVQPWGPGYVYEPRARLAPAWGARAYTNEQLAYHPRDFGQCEIDHARRMVYCGVKSGSVVALSVGKGNIAWEFKTHGAVRAKPLLTDQGLFVGSSDGCLYRLDPVKGNPTWEKPYCTDAAVYGDPVERDGVVYFAVSINKLYAIDAASGEFKWEYHVARPQYMSSEGIASPTVHGSHVYIGFSDGTLAAVDLLTGKPAWSMDLSMGSRKKATDTDTTPVIDGDVLYAASFVKGPVALRLKDHRQLWRGTWFGATRPALTASMAVIGTADGEVVGLRRKDGKVLFVTRLSDTAAYPPLVVRGILIVAGDKGLYTMALEDGAPIERLAFPMGTRNAPAVWGNRLFFVGGGGLINAIDIKFR
ncbi:MAG: PQQ-binding-like beta-propeller repeat protein [Deltaproteobacteria bacterium]|nr:PQQ-binding-like beta-propeller repeat protein [Deltaproteobacteria bacterium]